MFAPRWDDRLTHTVLRTLRILICSKIVERFSNALIAGGLERGRFTGGGSARRDDGIGPEFRHIAGTVCPGRAYERPYSETRSASKHYPDERYHDM